MGAAFNALMEEGSKESIAILACSLLEENRELLEALKAMVELFGDYADMPVLNARKAIAKAEGK